MDVAAVWSQKLAKFKSHETGGFWKGFDVQVRCVFSRVRYGCSRGTVRMFEGYGTDVRGVRYGCLMRTVRMFDWHGTDV